MIICQKCGKTYVTIGKCPYCQKSGQETKKSGHSKYHNIRVSYQGEWFDSIFEKECFEKLILLQKAGDVKYIFIHPLIRLKAHINYTPDFMVIFSDNRIEFWEAKGFETPAWRIKLKLWNEQYPDLPIKVIKKLDFKTE